MLLTEEKTREKLFWQIFCHP